MQEISVYAFAILYAQLQFIKSKIVSNFVAGLN